MEATDERFIPGTSRITEIESRHRYQVASEFCRGRRVLDAASGEGYGSGMMAEVAATVTGVDFCAEAIGEAGRKYRRENLRFVCADLRELPFGDGEFDVIVSFETIEHVRDQRRVLGELRRVLSPQGLLIMSSPNRTPFGARNYRDGRVNPHHVAEMESSEFESLLREYFSFVRVDSQDAFYNSVISSGSVERYFVKDADGATHVHDGLRNSQYAFAFASAVALPELRGSCYLDVVHDPVKGYLWDDESVPNQFGLRDEFEKVYAERQSLRGENESLKSEAEKHRRQREKFEAENCAMHSRLDSALGECDRLKRELDEAGVRYRDERAKSEYLYGELTALQNDWPVKVLKKLAIRRRIRGLLHASGSFVHRFCKPIFLSLPISSKLRQMIKETLYSHCGPLLKGVRGYQNWLNLKTIREGLVTETDTGLIVPEDVPLTSIVIPVYNNLSLTEQCLRSIYAIGSKSPFEIVIVDDCSSERYETLTREFPGIRILRNERNSGFLLTANRGGREAKGEYLIFLNNDTEVQPGWMDELTTALYHHPEAGMIGSQLIHMATNRLQESGNLICKDGRMLPLGRGEKSDHPEFNYFREVDFSSAASIIMRKSVFDEMNGFDTAYAPAYFEDPDLGLRMQKAGYHNYVMPLSRVIHQEMASYGDALDERCEKNRRFFVERWSGYLAEHSLYDTPEAFVTERKFPRPRILYIDAEVPMADRGSGGMDAIYFMEYFLKRGYDVVFHGEYTPGYVPKYTTVLLRMGVECVYQPYRMIWEYISSNGWTFSTLFVSRIYQARCFDALLKKYCNRASYIFNTVDLHFVREKLEADLQKDASLLQLAEQTRRYELQAASSADATIVISSKEKNLLNSEYGMKNVWHVPQMREIHGRADGSRSGAVFIGSAHPPNMDGLKFFHDEILPLLPSGFRLTVVGEALKKMIGETERYRSLLRCPAFEFVGFVADLGTVLDRTLLTVAPLRYGAGTKGKVASSMSYGVPCVSSRFGTEGTGMVHGENILIADTPAEFARSIREVMSNAALWRQISDGGLRFLRDNYSREYVDSIMDDLMESVRKKRGMSKWSSAPVLPKVD